MSPCETTDVVGSLAGQTVEHVWCFRGANGDSSWPAIPPAQDTGSRHDRWDHWSRFDPPNAVPNPWHVTTRHESFFEGDTYNAWLGCDSIPGSPGFCADTATWTFQDGYGDGWNFALTLDLSTQDATTGGTIEFDIRYDSECNADYAHLEYLNEFGQWLAVIDSAGAPAVFNAISGNPDVNGGGSGRSCGEDIYGHSDERDIGMGPQPFHGNSLWLEAVSFPLPAQAGGIQLRWRGLTDFGNSDAAGGVDSDGLVAIDNVSVTLDASGSVVSDDFETGDFNGLSVTIGSASWITGGVVGSTYDGWHLSFDPMYKNKGNMCFFNDDWMWAAKPDVGSIPASASGFAFFLVSPVINTTGWTGGVVEYDQYICMDFDRQDAVNTHARVYDSNQGKWTAWSDLDGFITIGGCSFWFPNQREDLSPFLGSGIDSLQFAFETLDFSADGGFGWGKHAGVQHLIDNVAFGSFDGTVTVFVARSIDLFTDTFSRSDPAHTPFLANADQGDWSGGCGGRAFSDADSFTVDITDVNGVTASNVVLWWRHDDGGAGFGVWNGKTMNFANPSPVSLTDEGTYRQIIGADDGGVEDAEGTASNCLVWKAGTTVEYYVLVTDDTGAPATFPKTASEPQPSCFEFSVFPLGNTTLSGERILVVDDYDRTLLDVENSASFDPSGGLGFGNFVFPQLVEPEALVAEALDFIYPGGSPAYDVFEVLGAGSSVQTKPRGLSNSAAGVGGYMDDAGNPQYDLLIWLQGTISTASYADTTRLELAQYLDNGGHLLSTGDNVSAFLVGTDPGFLETHLGTDSPVDDATEVRILNVAGEGGTPYEGFEVGLYGECPLRRDFDRLTLATPAGGSTNRVLMAYSGGGVGDEGRAAIIQNDRTGGGTAINMGFGISAFPSRYAIACYLARALKEVYAFADPNFDCGATGVPAGLDTAPSGYQLGHAAPNPFRSEAEIRFALPTRERVKLQVFNVLGQRIRTLVDEVLEADVHTRRWNGVSDNGAQVAPGLYFYRLEAGGFEATAKVVRIR